MAGRQIPSKMRQIMVKQLGTKFREITEIIESPLPTPGPKHVIVKNRFVGINASDINYTAGRYDPDHKPPFPAGFEGLGEVVVTGQDTKLKVGQSVVYRKFGAFADYIAIEETIAMPIPSSDPAFLTLPISGLTASVSLEKLGNLKPGKIVLVTAAAGGTGQFAVQVAKLAGCHVIGTCSSGDKAAFLKSIGCDRAINYKTENLDDVLSKEYPKGVDVVYESVGNEIFAAALKNLAIFGRLIVIGQIANYPHGMSQSQSKVNIPMTLLYKSASVQGFFLPHYQSTNARHMEKLSSLHKVGKLKVFIDCGKGVPNGPFVGLEKVADAVEYLYSRKNVGKVVVEVTSDEKSVL